MSIYHLHFQTFGMKLFKISPFYHRFPMSQTTLGRHWYAKSPTHRAVTFVPPVWLGPAAASHVHWEWKSCLNLRGSLRAESEFSLPSLLSFFLGSWPYKFSLLWRFLGFLMYMLIFPAVAVSGCHQQFWGLQMSWSAAVSCILLWGQIWINGPCCCYLSSSL